jgi:streptomycin 6-kinase
VLRQQIERGARRTAGSPYPANRESLAASFHRLNGHLLEGIQVTATWETLDRPLPERTVDHALACAERRIGAHDNERARLVHGDVHQWNALESSNGFALVDPDGLLAEPEYDLGIIMREDPVELLEEGPWNRAHRLVSLTGLDLTAIWEWGVVERVSTGLLCTQLELQPVGRDMLAAAQIVAEL